MPDLSRRSFLRLGGGGVIAAATTAEIGMWAEFMNWLQRKPVWSIPAKPIYAPDLSQWAIVYYNRKSIERLKENFTLYAMPRVVKGEKYLDIKIYRYA